MLFANNHWEDCIEAQKLINIKVDKAINFDFIKKQIAHNKILLDKRNEGTYLNILSMENASKKLQTIRLTILMNCQ